MEKKIAILASICKKYNCKVVIEASAKDAIDEETLEIDEDCEWVRFIFDMFKKYKIEGNYLTQLFTICKFIQDINASNLFDISKKVIFEYLFVTGFSFTINSPIILK